jgi:hypothetical protein
LPADFIDPRLHLGDMQLSRVHGDARHHVTTDEAEPEL